MRTALNAEQAEVAALQILAHLAGDDDSLDRFIALTGIGLDDLKARAQEPGVLIAVLEYYLNHEPSLVAMADATGMDPTLPAQAHHALLTASGAEIEY